MDTTKINLLFKEELRIINMGLAAFGDNLAEDEIQVLQMDWRPPAGGNEKMIALLKKLGR